MFCKYSTMPSSDLKTPELTCTHNITECVQTQRGGKGGREREREQEMPKNKK